MLSDTVSCDGRRDVVEKAKRRRVGRERKSVLDAAKVCLEHKRGGLVVDPQGLSD